MGILTEVVDGRGFHGRSFDELRSGPMAARAKQFGATLKGFDAIDSGESLKARVNHSRWIVDCPDCRGAEFAWREKGLFMCQTCFNTMVGGKWRRVEFPDDQYEIEDVLAARPMAHQRNWSPGEILDELKAENVLRGYRPTRG